MPKTIDDIQSFKNSDQPLVALTAYTAPMAEILDPICDLLLVGDSLGMVVYGMNDTLGVSVDMMIAHGKAVMRKRQNAFVVVDVPYGSFEQSPQQAVETCKRIVEETGCDAVKIEGDDTFAPTTKALCDAGISVIAHIGLQPQSVQKEGGYKIKGKTIDEAQSLFKAAKAHEQAGAFCILIEGTIDHVATDITRRVSVPVIGIGAGASCDGQILVTEDIIGMLSMRTPKFAKRYTDLKSDIAHAAQSYAEDVRTKRFPSEEYSYQIPADLQKKAS